MGKPTREKDKKSISYVYIYIYVKNDFGYNKRTI